MKRIFVILLTKIVYLIGKIIGKGSSLPGKIALYIYPEILSRLALPENIVVITGSNGKTTTAGMINHILTQKGFTVGYNAEGSNQIEGVATLLLRLSDIFGKVKRDVLILEVDERYTKYVLRYITPKFYVVTNLYRDQLTRNGHPEYIYGILSEGLNENMHLVLNADDPLSSMLGLNHKNVTYFGIDENSESKKTNTSIYNDGAYCPNCKHKLHYDYYHFNHIGSYNCKYCGHKKHIPQFNVTGLNFAKNIFSVNNEQKIKISLKSFCNIYNLLTAFTVASLLGVDKKNISRLLKNYVLKNGRIIEFKTAFKKGIMLLSKHENSISYNQSLMYIAGRKEECTVVIIVDAVSRKYYTSETSWLWDIDFEMLKCEKVKNIILTGKYAFDLAVRFDYTGIEKEKVDIIPDISKVISEISDKAASNIYVLTCFSDKDKFLSRVNMN